MASSEMWQAVQLHGCVQNKGACRLRYPAECNWSVFQHHAVPSYKVGSTLTMPLPMQGGCNFIVGHLLFYCELLPVLFRFSVPIPAFITYQRLGTNNVKS